MFRIRFRLITLFAVMTLIALAVGVFGIYRRAVMAEDLAYQKIAAKGGWIVVYTSDSHVEFLTATAQPFLDCGTGVERTYSPQGTANDFDDDDLATFEDVKRMCNINFANTRVTLAAAKKFAARHPTWRIYHSNVSLNEG